MTVETGESYKACKELAGQIFDSTDSLDETENGRATYFRSNALAVLQGIVLRLVHEEPVVDQTVALPPVELIQQVLSMPIHELANWLSTGNSRIAASNFCKLQKENSKHCPIVIEVLKNRMAIYREILKTPEVIEENLVKKEYERMPKRYYPNYKIDHKREGIALTARSPMPPSALRYSQAELDREKQWYLGRMHMPLGYTLSIIDTPYVDEAGVFDGDGNLLYRVPGYPDPECVRFTKDYFVHLSDPRELSDPCLTFLKGGATVRSYTVVDLLRRQSYLKLFTDRPSIFDCSDPIVATAGRWWLSAHLNERIIYVITREGLSLEFRLEDGGELGNRLSNEFMIDDAEELLNGARIRASVRK